MGIGPESNLRESKDILELMRVALGRQAADLVVSNARLVNVHTGEILDNQTVGVKGKWIACVGPDSDGLIGPRTDVIDAAGRTLIPGLIDGHTHVAWLVGIASFLEHAMRGGTTTIITETMEAFPVAGKAGVMDFLDSLRNQPVKIFATAPFMASISRSAAGIDAATLTELLAEPDVIALGESYWQAVLQEPDRAVASMTVALKAGKPLEGHSAGARGKKLAAYAATGVSSCHEPIRPEEVLERLRLGLYVMIREGGIRRDLAAISKIKDAGIDARRLILVTDGVEPGDLIENGYMEKVVQKAIDCGFSPVQAIQMATVNVAEHFALDDIVGAIAPGRCADLVLIPDERTIAAETVISDGRIVAQNGRVTVAPRQHRFTAASLHTIDLPRPLSAADFAIQAPPTAPRATVRVIEMVTDLVTRETQMDVPVTHGCIPADPEVDLLKAAAIDRRFVPGRIFTGLIKGFGLHGGAFACSAAWDTADIIVVGAEDADMAAAVNRIHELQGGAVVCVRGDIRCELALPVFGILSTASTAQIARRLAALRTEVARLGCSFPDPLLTLITLTGAAIPYLRICDEGLVNLRENRTMGLFVTA
jgi:adenine deaminase